MRLRGSPTSPFVRKVRIAADIAGLADQITVDMVDTINPPADFLDENPLGKIPALVLDNGEALYDSRVIAAFLDMTAGDGRLIPAGMAGIHALKREALGDGIMDAGVLCLYEGRFRAPEKQDSGWVSRQRAKADRGLAHLEKTLPGSEQADALDIGAVSIACALGFFDFRFNGEWRQTCPGLAGWLENFSHRVPAYAATAPVA